MARNIRRAVATVAAVVAVVVGLSGFTGSPARAASNGRWQVLPKQADPRRPSRVFFTYDVRGADELRDAVTISNLTEEPLTLRLRTADAVNAAGTAAWALQPAASPPVDVGSWIVLDRSSVVVPAQGKVDVAFVLRVPENASPGDHAGGVIAANSEPETAVVEGSGRVSVVREVGVRIYARVAGAKTPRLRVGPVHVERRGPLLPFVTGTGHTTIRYRVRNTGNVRLAVTSEVHFTDVFGRTVKRLAPLKMSDVLPGADVPVEQEWGSAPPVGRVTARVRLHAEGVNVSTATSVWAVPWFALLLVGSAVAVVAGLVRWRRVRRRDPHRQPAG